MKMSRDKKIARFNKKYANKGGFAKFREMVRKLYTLDKIGKHFGFSRQNAAGLYRSFFNESYGKILRKRMEKKLTEIKKCYDDLEKLASKLEENSKNRSARKVRYIKVVKEEAEKRGMDVKLSIKRSGAIEMFINGHSVSVSGTSNTTIYHIPRSHEPSVYLRFAVPSRQTDFCIFVLNMDSHFTYYIVPHEEIKHLTLITLKDVYANELGRKGNTSSKYAQYRNRWDLLEQPSSSNGK